MLIPTRRKPRIGADLAYPIGAERLSTAIGNRPALAGIARHGRSPWRQGRLRALLRSVDERAHRQRHTELLPRTAKR